MHTVLHGVSGQSLRHHPHEVTAAATYVLEDLTYHVADSTSRVLASGTATVATATATATAACGGPTPEPKRWASTGTTGVDEGQRVIVVSTTGRSEHATVVAVDTDVAVYLEHDLVDVYPAGSVLHVNDVTAPVPSAVYDDSRLVDDERPLRVVWTYSVAGRLWRAQEQLRVVRHQRGDYPIDSVVEAIQRGWPDIPARLPAGASLARWVEFCADDLAARLSAASIPAERHLGGEQYRQALIYRVVMHAADNGHSPGNLPADVFRDQMEANFKQHWGSLMVGAPGRDVVETHPQSDTAGQERRTYRSPLGSM